MTQPTQKSGLDAHQLETLKQKLLAARSELEARRSDHVRARTDLVSEVEDEGDAASRANSEDELVSLVESEHVRLAEIEHALAKFDSGEYGLDEETDEPIDFKRLSILPWARYSTETQEALELKR